MTDKHQYEVISENQQQSYQARLVEYEDKRTALAEQEEELKRRLYVLNEREAQIVREEAATKSHQEKLIMEKRDIDDKAQEVTATSLRIHEESEVIYTFKNSIEQQR